MTEINTPHIKANKEDFAKTVLMPGDPLRAKFIAENFITDARLVNNVRNVQGYTGTYKGVPVTVMASGMGMPSIGIYSYELYNIFGVENIMRIGSAGSINMGVNLRDIVIGMGACTDSNFGSQFHLPGAFAPTADFKMMRTCYETAEELGLKYHVGNLVSSDIFYADNEGIPEMIRSSAAWSKMGVLAVEMEAAALYMNAARAGKHALAICTISDHVLTGEQTTSEERRATFVDMMKLALETAIKL